MNGELLTLDCPSPIGKYRGMKIKDILNTDEGKKKFKNTIKTFNLNVNDDILQVLG